MSESPKKNPLHHQDSQKTYDGPNQSARNLALFGAIAGQGYANPGMRMKTMKDAMKSIKEQLENLAGESTHVTMIVSDSTRLLEALSIRYGDTPIVEVVDMLLDEAYELHKKATLDNLSAETGVQKC